MTQICEEKGFYARVKNMLIGLGELPDEFKE
jgi:hypothetical protein